MANYILGAIVLVKFPFTDNSEFKKRPALVIADTNDGDVIVCRITSKPYSTSYDIELKNWKENGLQLPSYVRVHKIASLDKAIIDKQLGEIEDYDKLKIISIIGELIKR